MLDNFTAKDMYDRMIRANFQEELDMISDAAMDGGVSVDIPIQKVSHKNYVLFTRWLGGRGFGWTFSDDTTLEVRWYKSAYLTPSTTLPRNIDVDARQVLL